MATSRLSRRNLENLRFNTSLDGWFHAGTYVFVALGLIVLWRAARQPHLGWSGKLLLATMLMGFGIFNLVEGVDDHQLLGTRHVNETVPRSQWVYWDRGLFDLGCADAARRVGLVKRQAEILAVAAMKRWTLALISGCLGTGL